MLISPISYEIIKYGLGILFFAICFYLLKQRFDSTRKAMISLIAGVVGFLVIQSTFSKIYIIDKELNYQELYLIGSTDQQLGNGKTISVSSGQWNHMTIVNKSEFKLVLEEIVYANSNNNSDRNGDYEVLPYTYIEVFTPRNKITYFFEDNIPDAINVSGPSSSESHYWIRLESEAGNDE